jgi:hypothetical protein
MNGGGGAAAHRNPDDYVGIIGKIEFFEGPNKRLDGWLGIIVPIHATPWCARPVFTQSTHKKGTMRSLESLSCVESPEIRELVLDERSWREPRLAARHN